MFNVLIALLLMLLGIFSTLEAVLSVYANVVIAWLGALVADLVVLEPLGISPAYIEFKRAHLYNINPVGCGAMLIASLISISAYAGFLGEACGAFSAFIALAVAFVSAVTIGYVTGGNTTLLEPISTCARGCSRISFSAASAKSATSRPIWLTARLPGLVFARCVAAWRITVTIPARAP